MLNCRGNKQGSSTFIKVNPQGDFDADPDDRKN